MKHCLEDVRTQDSGGCASRKTLSILSLNSEVKWSVAGVAAPVGVCPELGTNILSIRNVLSMPHLARVAASSRTCNASRPSHISCKSDWYASNNEERKLKAYGGLEAE